MYIFLSIEIYDQLMYKHIKHIKTSAATTAAYFITYRNVNLNYFRNRFKQKNRRAIIHFFFNSIEHVNSLTVL